MGIVETVKELLTELKVRPMVVTLALSLGLNGWLMKEGLKEFRQHQTDLKELDGATKETVHSQQRTIELQDTLLRYQDKVRNQLIDNIKTH